MISRRAAASAIATPAWLVGCTPSPVGIEGAFVGAGFERGHKLRDPAALAALRSQPAAAERTVDVLVLGGGVAGLAAADALSRSNRSFAVLDLEDRMGGNARSHLMRAGERMLLCPLGAHYLPVPPATAAEVQRLLVRLGLAQGEGPQFGLSAQGQRHLAHAPQERLWWPGETDAQPTGFWQRGLLPQVDTQSGASRAYERFASRLAQIMAQQTFNLPVRVNFEKNRSHVGEFRAFDAISFDEWLRAEGLNDARLRWYLNYCCRDDYGAGLGEVSAWAGLHYFASRHGFRAPGEASKRGEDRGVLAWPQGNAWLTERVAERIETARPGALQGGQVVLSVQETGLGTTRRVVVKSWHAAGERVSLWRAREVIVAMPLRAASRVLMAQPPELVAAVQTQKTSAWLVANIALKEPLIERERAADLQLAWDNVLFGSAGLGYIDASHQHIGPRGPTVLTWYHALGTERAAAQSLLELPWTHWRDLVIAELSGPHPDIVRKIERIDLMRYGHAMSVPAPGVYESVTGGALAALRNPAKDARIRFAHADLSGYSVFEEAWTLGVEAARASVA